MSGVRRGRPQERGDLRRYARLAVAAVAVLSFAWGGVQLVDPLPKAPGAEPVDASAPPAQVAYEAMQQPGLGSYVGEWFIGNDTSTRRIVRYRWDAADRQLHATWTWNGTGPKDVVYVDETGRWERRPGDDGPSWAQVHPPAFRLGPFSAISAVREPGADVALVARNESVVVLRVRDSDTAALVGRGAENFTGDNPAGRASLTLVVDRDTGMLRRSRYRQSVLEESDDNASRVVYVEVHRFRRWNDVDVRRPRGLPYTFDSVLFDLLDYCGGCVEDDP